MSRVMPYPDRDNMVWGVAGGWAEIGTTVTVRIWRAYKGEADECRASSLSACTFTKLTS